MWLVVIFRVTAIQSHKLSNNNNTGVGQQFWSFHLFYFSFCLSELCSGLDILLNDASFCFSSWQRSFFVLSSWSFQGHKLSKFYLFAVSLLQVYGHILIQNPEIDFISNTVHKSYFLLVSNFSYHLKVVLSLINNKKKEMNSIRTTPFRVSFQFRHP